MNIAEEKKHTRWFWWPATKCQLRHRRTHTLKHCSRMKLRPMQSKMNLFPRSNYESFSADEWVYWNSSTEDETEVEIIFMRMSWSTTFSSWLIRLPFHFLRVKYMRKYCANHIATLVLFGWLGEPMKPSRTTPKSISDSRLSRLNRNLYAKWCFFVRVCVRFEAKATVAP